MSSSTEPQENFTLNQKRTCSAGKPVSLSCTVAKSEKFWGATGQTEENAPLAKVQLCEFKNQNLMRLAYCTPSLIVSGTPEFFTFSYCAWLWNWLIRNTTISYPEPSSFLLRMLDENEGLWKGPVLKVRIVLYYISEDQSGSPKNRSFPEPFVFVEHA